MSENDSIADRIEGIIARLLTNPFNNLTRTYLFAAVEDVRELERLYGAIQGACLHYGADPIYKFDGGRRPAFCAICGEVIYRWR